MAPTLGYWHTRGLANQIRLLLKYNGVDFEDKTYTSETAQDWFEKDKKDLGLTLPNLPYYIDGDVKLSETLAIVYYLGRKYKMVGSTEEEMCRNDAAYSFNWEVRMSAAQVFFNPDYDNLKQGLLDSLDGRFSKYDSLLEDRNWFTGDKIAMCDFSIYDLLDILRNFSEGCLHKYPRIEAFMKRFEELPKIKAYMESDACIKSPFYGPNAKWGGK